MCANGKFPTGKSLLMRWRCDAMLKWLICSNILCRNVMEKCLESINCKDFDVAILRNWNFSKSCWSQILIALGFLDIEKISIKIWYGFDPNFYYLLRLLSKSSTVATSPKISFHSSSNFFHKSHDWSSEYLAEWIHSLINQTAVPYRILNNENKVSKTVFKCEYLPCNCRIITRFSHRLAFARWINHQRHFARDKAKQFEIIMCPEWNV